PGLSPSPRLSRGAPPPARSGRSHPVRRRDRAALVCAGGVWRAHAERPRHARAGGDRLRVPRRIRAPVDPHHVSLAPARAVPHPDLPRVGGRELRHAPGRRRNPLPVPAPLPEGSRLSPYSATPPLV